MTVLHLSIVCFTIGFYSACKAEVQLEFLENVSDLQGTGIKLSESTPMLPTLLNRAKKICASGVWAMYTKPNYGRDDTANTIVYPITGSASPSCTTSSVESVLRTIRSIRVLQYEENRLTHFEKPYFLPKNESFLLTNSENTTLSQAKSFASLVNKDMVHLYCNTTDAEAANIPYRKCVCFEKGTSYLIPDIRVYPDKSSPLKIAASVKTSTACPAGVRSSDGIGKILHEGFSFRGDVQSPT